MATRQLKFTGNIGAADSTADILINGELVYSGALGSELEPSSLSSQPAIPLELITVNWEGNEKATEVVSVEINVTDGEVRIGPIWSDFIDPDTNSTIWQRRYGGDYEDYGECGDGRFNVIVNGSAVSIPVAGDHNNWNGWCFNILSPGTFKCDCIVSPQVPFVSPAS